MPRTFTLVTALSLAYAVAVASVTVNERQVTPSTASRFWGYGGGPEQRRYSTLSQIDRTNVSRLAVAWTYDTGEPGAMQTQPLVVGDLLYGYTPAHKAFAVNAATGARVWTFDSGLRASGPNRGLMYWTDGTEARVFAAVNSFVYALDAATGVVIESFGTVGRIDLREHLGRDPRTQSVILTTPGVIYKDLMIVGGRLSESLPAAPGDIRAYDVKTGTLRWSFHTIPRAGEFGSETWPRRAREYAGGANSWSGMALDERRGIVYVPTGSAASDFYGADRRGDNLFSNSLIALDANTGRRLWHFQFVRHDLWDRDLPSPPTLVTVQRGGRSIDAVAQATKQGFVFVFDRVTGTPLFPIEYGRYPASTLPGEITRPTQPLPLKPAPFSRQRLTVDLLSHRTPAVRDWARGRFRELRSAGQFVPFAVDRPTVVFPGYDGGAEWGGQAFDPETTLYYVNANDLAWTGRLAPNTSGRSGRGLYLHHCASCHRDDRLGTPPQIPSLVDLAARRDLAQLTTTVRQGRGRMAGFPQLAPTAVNAIVQFVMTGKDTPPAAATDSRGSTAAPDPRINDGFRFTGYDKFLDPDGYPAVAPPWGTLNAIDLNTGEYAWKVPLGEYPELAAQGLTTTGTENYGGPVVTAGGLVFIAATNHDRKMRAFDKATGALLWESTMPSSGNATPAVYEARGRQFVVVAAGGGKSKSGGPGGVYVAFALPR